MLCDRPFLPEKVRINKQWDIKLFVLRSLFPSRLTAVSAVQNGHEGLSYGFFLFEKMVCVLYFTSVVSQLQLSHPLAQPHLAPYSCCLFS